MSSRGTTTSSLAQMYCCLRREPQALCRRLKEIARLASEAEKSFTGIETSPNETVSEAIDRAAMVRSQSSGANIIFRSHVPDLAVFYLRNNAPHGPRASQMRRPR